MKTVATFVVNGLPHEVAVEPHELLIEVLRDHLGLTGTKHSCGVGNCGACTVLVEGTPKLACLTLAMEVRNKPVLTIEGLACDGVMHPLQQAFVDHGAIQCGYCTPGMILTAKALLDGNPDPTEHEVREALSGNICRCTGYVKIVEAVLAAAEVMRKGATEMEGHAADNRESAVHQGAEVAQFSVVGTHSSARRSRQGHRRGQVRR